MMSSSNEFSGQRVTVMGLGQFGGGLGAAKFLLDRGARVTITDLRSAEELASSLAELDSSLLERLTLGNHCDEDFTTADLIVVNPAVQRPGNHFLDLAAKQGIPLTSEMNLFWEHCQARKIVVTGSVGKSTTATLLHQCLLTAGKKARLGGNLGISLLPLVDEIEKDEWVVLELSSFQLADLDRLQPRPDVAVVTNFFANHLDWHSTLDNYRQAKQSALCYQTADDVAVLNGDDSDSALWPTDAQVCWFGHDLWRDKPGVMITPEGLEVRSRIGGWKIELADLAPCLRSEHGLANAAAALAAVVVGLEIPVDAVAPALLDYQPLPHRLEFVAEINGRTFINDSKATTPEATIAGLKSMTEPVILIAGGKDKGIDLSQFAAEIANRVTRVALIGETADTLKTLLSEHDASANVFVFRADSLERAVQWAYEQSTPGDVILLSPGCSSHGDFTSYEQRGEQFAEFAKALC